MLTGLSLPLVQGHVKTLPFSKLAQSSTVLGGAANLESDFSEGMLKQDRSATGLHSNLKYQCTIDIDSESPALWGGEKEA